jgi:uncharacterized cupredoxin-like copper-binding protein
MIKRFLILFFVVTTVSCAQMFQPKLAVQETTHNFGDIVQGEKVTHIFVLTNNGGDLLKISNVTASCGCTAAKPEKNELAPGESTNLVVTFNSSGRHGAQTKTVKVFSNDPDQPEKILTITGNVVTASKTSVSPVIFFPETQHDFGKVSEGKKVEYTFKVVNKGNSVLTIKDIKTSCGCTAALLSQEKLEPGQEGTLKVELDTKNRKGKMSRTITITSNDPKEPKKILTVYADITKEGT